MKSFKEGFDEFLERSELTEHFETEMEKHVKYTTRHSFVHGAGFLLEILGDSVESEGSYDEFVATYKEIMENMRTFDDEIAAEYKSGADTDKGNFSGWKQNMEVKTKGDKPGPDVQERHLNHGSTRG
jgi:hypothetical protein